MRLLHATEGRIFMSNIRKAFENSMMGKGTSFVEVVGTCNSGWKLSPVKANKWMEENMFPFYPLGDMKDR